MAKKVTEKRAGRPAGAKTQERVSVEQIISRDACPHCASQRPPTNKRLLREGPASGECKGVPYSYYKLYACNCAGCGLGFRLREYEPV